MDRKKIKTGKASNAREWNAKAPDKPPTVSQLILVRKMLSKRAIFILDTQSKQTHGVWTQKSVITSRHSESAVLVDLLLVFLHQSLGSFTTVEQIPAYQTQALQLIYCRYRALGYTYRWLDILYSISLIIHTIFGLGVHVYSNINNKTSIYSFSRCFYLRHWHICWIKV